MVCHESQTAAAAPETASGGVSARNVIALK